MRNPEITKKMSTPINPNPKPGTPKWLDITRITATALKAAMSDLNPFFCGVISL
jgi:hypothetical protein